MTRAKRNYAGSVQDRTAMQGAITPQGIYTGEVVVKKERMLEKSRILYEKTSHVATAS